MPLKDNPFLQQDQQRRRADPPSSAATPAAAQPAGAKAAPFYCSGVLPPRRPPTAPSFVPAASAPAPPPPRPRSAPSQPADAPAADPHRHPSEHDPIYLVQALAIKDAMLRQMEAALLLPPPPQHEVRAGQGLSARGAALVANGRRREAVLSLKLRALQAEVRGFRERERDGIQANQALRSKLEAAVAEREAQRVQRARNVQQEKQRETAAVVELKRTVEELTEAKAQVKALRRQLRDAQAEAAAERQATARVTAYAAELETDVEYLRSLAGSALAGLGERALDSEHR